MKNWYLPLLKKSWSMQHMRKNIVLMTVLSLCHSFGSSNAVASNLAKSGGEYLVGGFIPGDQTNQSIALNSDGGYITWNDHQADNDGLGISLLHVDSNISSAFDPLTVNVTTEGDQRDAQVVMLEGDSSSAVVVWEGNGDIYARFISSDGTFSTGEILVNSYQENIQNRPSVAALSNGNVAVAWSSLGQDGSHYGVYGRILNSAGLPVSDEFGLTQETDYNQRSVSLTSTIDGGFQAVWISEQLAGISDSIDIDGRIDFFSGGRQFNIAVKGRKFGQDGSPQSVENTLTSSDQVASNPQIVNTEENLTLIYAAKPKGQQTENSWDIYAQGLSLQTNHLIGDPILVNSIRYGDQFVPRASVVDGGYFVTWTSLGHDGDVEGVYGNLIQNGQVNGEDILINTTTSGRQFLSSVANLNESSWVVSWSGFSTLSRSMEIYAQKYNISSGRIQPASVYAFSSGANSINAVWPIVNDETVAGYRISIDQLNKTFETDSNSISIDGLKAGQSYEISLSYIYQDGSTSVANAEARVSTWGNDGNHDGLPDSWQTLYFGSDQTKWLRSEEDADNDGASNMDELLAGTSPSNGSDVLAMELLIFNDQTWLSWTTVEGGIYQLQQTSSLNVWQNVGLPRFAADDYDAVQINNSAELNLYRIVRLK